MVPLSPQHVRGNELCTHTPASLTLFPHGASSLGLTHSCFALPQQGDLSHLCGRAATHRLLGAQEGFSSHTSETLISEGALKQTCDLTQICEKLRLRNLIAILTFFLLR